MYTPAFPDIGAPRLLADRGESETPQIIFQLGIVFAHGYLRLEPGREPQSRLSPSFSELESSAVAVDAPVARDDARYEVLQAGPVGQARPLPLLFLLRC